MYTELATRLDVTTTAGFSQPVSMAGENSVTIDTTVFYNSAAAVLTLALEGSNDLQNWKDLSYSLTSSAPEYAASSSAKTGIGYAYVRLKWSIASGNAIINTGVDVFTT